MRAFCLDCGAAFHREVDESWKVRCLPCFKSHKRANDDPDYRAQWQRSDAECLRLRTRVADLEARLMEADSALTGELRDMLPRLRQLCHPDRHEGSLAANRASQWLNEVHGRLN